MLNCEPFPSPPHPRLDLVVDQQNVVFVEDFLQSLEIILRWNHVSAFALNWFDEHCRCVFMGDDISSDLLFDEVNAPHLALSGYLRPKGQR